MPDFSSFFGQSPINTDTSNFNYTTESEKVKRQRALAQQLMQTRMSPTQTVSSGVNNVVVKKSPLEAIATLLQGGMGAYMSRNSDTKQDSVDKTSQAALTAQLQGMGARVRDPNQDQVEADAQLVRESRRGSGVDAGQVVGDNQDPQAAQTLPVAPQSQIEGTPLQPVASITPAARAQAAKVLQSTEPEQQVIQGGPYVPQAASSVRQSIYNPGTPSVNPPGIYSTQAASSVPQGIYNPAPQGNAGRGSVNSALVNPNVGAMVAGSVPTPPAPTASQNAPTAVPQMATAPAMPVPEQNAAMPPAAPLVTNPDPYSRNPNQQEVISRLSALAKTGPEGAAVAQAQFAQMFGSKNGRYNIHADPVNGGFIRVDSATGRVESISGAGGNEKVLETKIGSDGNLLERTHSGWRPAQMQGGSGPVMTQEGKQQQQKETADKSKAQLGISTMKTQLASMQEVIPLIAKVGTGRLQTPWNKVSSFFSNSDDFDKMSRAFNGQQLAGAVEWLKGQGSVTEGERAILASSQFQPDGSTQSNIDYANKVIGMLQRNIPLAEQSYQQQYSGGNDSTNSTTSPPAGAMYSWQKK